MFAQQEFDGESPFIQTPQEGNNSVQTNRLKNENLLFEISLIRKSIRNSKELDFVDADTFGYVVTNEFTHAIEAISHGHLSITYQEWNDGRFTSFGNSLLDIMKRGLTEPGIPDFERKRREAELAEEISLVDFYMSGSHLSKVKVTISPFPDNTDSQSAAKRGYDPDNKLAKIRMYDIDSQGTRKTIVADVYQSDPELFATLLETYSGIEISNPTAQKILEAGFYTEIDRSNIPNGLTDIVKTYDDLLRQKYGGYYFFGRKVDGVSTQAYWQMDQRREFVEQQSSEYIFKIINLDYELARSLELGTPTSFIRERLFFFSSFKSNSGKLTLNSDEHAELVAWLSGNSEDPELAAKILKEKELIRIWTSLLIEFNPDRAEEIFGSEVMKETITSQNSDIETKLRVADRLLQDTEINFYTCSGLFSSELATVYRNPLEALINTFFNEGTGWKKGYCRVKDCPQKHQLVDVGPCKICRICEERSNRGEKLEDGN